MRPLIFYTVEDGCLNTKNPNNEPPILKTLDLRVKYSFHLRVGNLDLRQKSRENTKDFFTRDLKMAAKNYRGYVQHSSFFQMKCNQKTEKTNKKY